MYGGKRGQSTSKKDAHIKNMFEAALKSAEKEVDEEMKAEGSGEKKKPTGLVSYDSSDGDDNDAGGDELEKLASKSRIEKFGKASTLKGAKGSNDQVHNSYKRQKIEETTAKRVAVNVGRSSLAGPSLADMEDDSSDEEDNEEKKDDTNGNEEATESKKPKNDSDSGSDYDSEGDLSYDELVQKYSLPISHEVMFSNIRKPVNVVTFDPPSARMATGGHDSQVRLWDFQGMNNKVQAFRTFEPVEAHQVQRVSYSPSGSEMLVCCGNAHAKIYNRDGRELLGCHKGDMYVTDPKNTKGHVSMITDGQWHPTDKTTFMTCSTDGTVRLWDTKSRLTGVEQLISHSYVMRPRSSRNLKVLVSTAVYSHDGQKIVAGCQDGSLQVFCQKSKLYLPSMSLADAHLTGSDISSIYMFKDGNKMVSRATDDTMKLWDLRFFKRPVVTWDNLPSISPKTSVVVGRNESVIATGTSVDKKNNVGKIYFFDAYSRDKILDIGVSNSHVIGLSWSDKLNQIAVGAADSLRMLYSPEYSQKGALYFVGKRVKERENLGVQFEKAIINPSALPEFRAKRVNRRKEKERILNDPTKTCRPEQPLQGPGKGGRLGTKSSLTQFMMQGLHKLKSREEDPQQAILKHAEAAKADPGLVGPAYRNTQPENVLDYDSHRYEENKFLETKVVKCPRCGMKLCTCPKK